MHILWLSIISQKFAVLITEFYIIIIKPIPSIVLELNLT